MKKGGLGSRLIVAGWGIPLLLGLTYLGGYWTALLIGAISLGALSEYYRLQRQLGRRPMEWIGLGGGLLVVAVWATGDISVAWAMVAVCLMILLTGLLLQRSHQDISATITGVCYPPLMMGTFLFIREWIHPFDPLPDEGRWLAFAVWGAIWIGDTAAYFGGRAFGKHPLAPAISPKKTVEGFIFGFFGAVIFGLLWWWIGLIHLDAGLAIGLAAGLFGQIGDLVESAIKREADVKDSGGLLPGHGGLLDRFDSLMTTAPIVAMYLFIRLKLF